MIVFSCVIPCSAKDLKSQKLQDLIDSIHAQDFPQDQIEILIETEGDSEQAKANGIRKAKGEICAMFCADNLLMDNRVFSSVKYLYDSVFEGRHPIGIYTKFYWYKKDDNSLNRYFSLMGNNDPIAYYLGKADRKPAWEEDTDENWTCMKFKDRVPSLGDNGFFFCREAILKSSLNHYYPMDVAEDLRKKGYYTYIRSNGAHVWHRTSDNLINFLIKRYKYARDLFSDRGDRRWRIVDTKEDYWSLCWFCISTVTVLPSILISIRGFSKIRDWAWFWHWPCCFGFLITYTILAIRNLFKHGALFQRRSNVYKKSRKLQEAI